MNQALRACNTAAEMRLLGESKLAAGALPPSSTVCPFREISQAV